MNVELSGTSLALALVGTLTLLIALILLLRSIYTRRTAKALQNGFSGPETDNRVAHRTKYERFDVFGLRPTFLNLGLAVAVACSLMAFSWTEYTAQAVIPDGALELLPEIEMTPPRTPNPPPPPPPPPPPVIEKVPEEELLLEEPPEFVDMSITEEDVFEEVKQEIQAEEPAPAPVLPPPLPPVKDKMPDFVKFAEQMPLFPGCEDISPYEERRLCAEKRMLQFIYGKIKYPAIARENGIEGTAYVSFIVEQDGSLTQMKIVRDPGGQLGDEALRVISSMQTDGIMWNPGIQNGSKVRVQFNLPVKFELQ